MYLNFPREIEDLQKQNKFGTTPVDVICEGAEPDRCRWLHDLRLGDGTSFCDAELRSRLLDIITGTGDEEETATESEEEDDNDEDDSGL